jgi:hypothetical protein
MATERKPAPPGYERHPLDPNLMRKVPPRTAASDFYPYLPSNEQHRAREDAKEREALAKKREGR